MLKLTVQNSPLKTQMSKLTCCNSQDEARAKRTKTKRLRPGTLPPPNPPVQKQKVSGTLLRQKKTNIYFGSGPGPGHGPGTGTPPRHPTRIG